MGISVWAVLILVAGFATVTENRSESSTSTQVLSSAAYLAVFGFMILRMARARLCLLPGGVVVVNYLRSRFIPWPEINGFSLRPWGLWWTPIGHVELQTGSSVPVLGIGRSSPALWPKRAPADAMIRELNELLDARRRLAQ